MIVGDDWCPPELIAALPCSSEIVCLGSRLVYVAMVYACMSWNLVEVKD